MENIITGERLQNICDVYLGPYEIYNPNIDKSKIIDIYTIQDNYDNPNKIFCYSKNIEQLCKIIHYFKNKFILISHNSDYDILNTDNINKLLNNDKLVKWYAQNLTFTHEKIHIAPIGLANSQWKHGNLSLFNDINFMNNIQNKSLNIYFNFDINTNKQYRQECYDKLKNKINFLPKLDSLQNLQRLSNYKFCICPRGNGIDTHRLWEALYLRVVPICINDEFVNILKNEYKVPLLIINKWEDLDINSLNYNEYDFDNDIFKKIIDIKYYKSLLIK